MIVTAARLALAFVILGCIFFACALIVALGWHAGNYDALLAGGALSALLAALAWP